VDIRRELKLRGKNFGEEIAYSVFPKELMKLKAPLKDGAIKKLIKSLWQQVFGSSPKIEALKSKKGLFKIRDSKCVICDNLASEKGEGFLCDFVAGILEELFSLIYEEIIETQGWRISCIETHCKALNEEFCAYELRILEKMS
jgi:predicted hydrocarbon binding protein